MNGTLFLTWVPHRRTREIARLLLMPVVELQSAHRGLVRYTELALRTLRVLTRMKPRVLIVQSPSLVLALFALVLRPLYRFRVVVDAHNESVEPFLNRSPPMLALTRFQLRAADLVIVTNEPLAERVRNAGGRAAVLPDAVPEAPNGDPIALEGDFRVAIISSFAADEPLEAVLEAASLCPTGTRFFMTGNPSKLSEPMRAALPANVTLTGFLSEERYWSLLRSCDAVLDLTLMPDCLVCGAYEGIALGKPLILSDNRASMQTFAGFGLFTDCEPAHIVSAVTEMRARASEIQKEIPASRERFVARWLGLAHDLEKAIGGLRP